MDIMSLPLAPPWRGRGGWLVHPAVWSPVHCTSYHHTPPLHHSSSWPEPQTNDPASYLTGSWISLSLPMYNHEKYCKSIFVCNGFSKVKKVYMYTSWLQSMIYTFIKQALSKKKHLTAVTMPNKTQMVMLKTKKPQTLKILWIWFCVYLNEFFFSAVSQSLK